MSDQSDTSEVVAELKAIRTAIEAGPAEGLDAAAAAALVGISRSKWHDLDARGLCPAAVQIGVGRCPRWLRSELIGWLRAGAPARSRWLVIRRAG